MHLLFYVDYNLAVDLCWRGAFDHFTLDVAGLYLNFTVKWVNPEKSDVLFNHIKLTVQISCSLLPVHQHANDSSVGSRSLIKSAASWLICKFPALTHTKNFASAYAAPIN